MLTGSAPLSPGVQELLMVAFCADFAQGVSEIGRVQESGMWQVRGNDFLSPQPHYAIRLRRHNINLSLAADLRRIRWPLRTYKRQKHAV